MSTPVMDLTGVIDSFLSHTLTVTRYSASAYGSDGRLDSPSSSTFAIRACVQPAPARELQRLPEGMRTKEVKAIWTPTELRTQGSGQDPDSVVIDGDAYEVQWVERWAELGNYWKALVLKKGN